MTLVCCGVDADNLYDDNTDSEVRRTGLMLLKLQPARLYINLHSIFHSMTKSLLSPPLAGDYQLPSQSSAHCQISPLVELVSLQLGCDGHISTRTAFLFNVSNVDHQIKKQAGKYHTASTLANPIPLLRTYLNH